MQQKLETWPQYVRRHSRNANQEDIAYAVSVDQTTVGRWLDVARWEADKRPTVEHVVKFAKAYGRKPVEAFVAAGFLAPDDISGPIQIAVSMDDVSDEAFVKGLADRLARYRRLAGNDGQDGLVPEDWGEDPGMDGMQNRN
jgi:hypothetical protein